MNLAQVARILSGFVLFFSLFQAVPLAFACFEERKEGVDAATGFAAGIAIGCVTALLLRLAGRGAVRGEFFRKEGLAAVAFVWVISGALGAIPFVWSHAVPSAPDAFFETISGLTTTGASVFGSGEPYRNVEDLPSSILLWRSLLHFIGGLGIVLMFLVFGPALGVTSKNLLQSEATGVASERLAPRLREQARVLMQVYVGLIALQTVLLSVFGMTWFDAFCHAAATVATGGFSTKNFSIGQYQSLAIELTCTSFSFLGSLNFMLLYELVRSRFTRPSALLRDSEFRVHVCHWLGVVLLVSLILRVWGARVVDPAPLSVVHDYTDYWRCLRDSLFNVTTIHTSTGFATADTQNWPTGALILMMWCMYVGGCTGGTSGGIKTLRLMVTAKLVAYAFRHFVRPKSVEKIKVSEHAVSPGTVSAVLAIVVLWAFSLALGTLVIALDPRLDLLTSFSCNATCMGGDGPAFSTVRALEGGGFEVANPGRINVGAYGGFGQLYGWQKLVLSAQMLLGRLEIYPLVALLAPGMWRR